MAARWEVAANERKRLKLAKSLYKYASKSPKKGCVFSKRKCFMIKLMMIWAFFKMLLHDGSRCWNIVFHSGKQCFLWWKTLFPYLENGISRHRWSCDVVSASDTDLLRKRMLFCSFLSFLHHLFHHYCCILTVFAHLLPPPTLLPPLQKCFVHRHFKRRVAEWQQNSKN